MADKPNLNFLRNLPEGPEADPLFEYLGEFPDPDSVAGEIVDLIERGDDLVAPAETFMETPSTNLFERWDHPVNAKSIHETDAGRLLCLPPGSNRFSTYRKVMPTVINHQLETNYPRLKNELANRPNLFFQGVFYPDEMTIENMEMISLHHGRNYVVRCDLSLEGVKGTKTIVLKPTSMGVESVLTSLLDELNRRMSPDLLGRIGPIRAPAIVSVDDDYGILEYLPGSNGVEILPRGINTGSIQALRSNEFPDEFDLSSRGLVTLVDEFAKQSALAFYLRFYDRKPDQMMFERSGDGKYRISHLDFGRSLKRNYSLPWKRYYATQRAPLVFEDHEVPYFESAASLIFLPHFIPEHLAEDHPPFEGTVRKRLRKTFVELGHFFEHNAEMIREHLKTLVGSKTQFDDTEVYSQKVTEEDVREIDECLRSFDPSPEDVFESVINLAQLERGGGAPSEHAEDRTEDSIYHRGVRSGKASRKLLSKNEGQYPYELADYKQGGQVFYDSEHQTLYIHFGPNPQRVIDFIYWQYSPHLAEFLEDAPSIEPNTEVTVNLNGDSTVRIPPGLVRRDVDFPTEGLNEVRQIARGFAAPRHVRDYLEDYNTWREQNPDASFYARERRKQEVIFEANMDGKEILQWYRQTSDPDSPVSDALTEIIHHLLNDSDYLWDKDPLKSLNDLVVNLGHKHEFIDELGRELLPDDPDLKPLYNSCFRLYNDELPVGFFPDKNPQHLAHNRIMLELIECFIEIVDLTEPEVRLIRTAGILHNLGMLDADFASLLMNPSDRLERPVFSNYLKSHPDFAVEQFRNLRDREVLTPPESVDVDRLTSLLCDHHRYWHDDVPAGDDRVLHEILHLADTLAVFSDQTRPDHWVRGFLELSELAPRWIDSQAERGRLSDTIQATTDELFSETFAEQINAIGRDSRQFLELYNALQLAGELENGLSPLNPHMIRELQNRHGRTIIDRIWTRVLETNIPVAEKVRIVRRLDELAPLFVRRAARDYAFVNASPRPIQRNVNQIKQHLDHDRTVILIGFFPRVTKSFKRFLDNHGDAYRDSIENIVAISGDRRLQFIRHSYPYEAEFEEPFHRIIQRYRNDVDPETSLFFIPFREFFEGYSPSRNPASRVRELEKASSVEEHTTPERVQTEAERYQHWCDRQEGTVDDHENERFRRILYNNFTNRDVLYFYRATLGHSPGVEEALKETIGALRENPNYLSERTSRYSLHELIRSLSQIHFFSDNPPRAYALLEDYLNRMRVNNPEPYRGLLDRLGTDLNFYKNTLATAVRILDLLKGSSALTPEELYLTLAAGQLGRADPWRDYLLSPEDISYNRTLRNRLLSLESSVTERVKNSESFAGLSEEVTSSVDNMLSAPDQLRFIRIQTALHLAHGIDFSRVENWERGHRRIEPRDLDNFFTPLESLVSPHLDDSALSQLEDEYQSLKSPNKLETLNALSSATHSFVYLHNSLNLASELRYGLFPGGVNSLDNARELYGTDRVNRILEGLIESDLSVVDSIKFSRKIRYFASAVRKLDQTPDKTLFLNLDRSGTWSLPGSIEGDRNALFVLSGELSNALSFWDRVRNREPRTADRCFCLIGEEYPLLIKETSLSRTEELRRRITQYRAGHDTAGRFLLVPADTILSDISPYSTRESDVYRDDPMSLFMRSWLKLFD